MANTSPMDHSLPLISQVCRLAGPLNFVDANRAALRRQGITGAVWRHDSGVLYNWLMTMVSFQGIADRVADQYIRHHGNITWRDVKADLKGRPDCPKLEGFWAFDNCRYTKSSWSCSQPNHISRCPLPRHGLRNGRLNQTAYSLFFFIRDIADGDLVQWIDDQLAAMADPNVTLAARRDALIDPLRGVYGVSDKVISMALSSLLLAGKRRSQWFDVGTSFVVVDSLVHNFLHRTGTLAAFGADHAFGPACYRPNGCAAIIDQLATCIDARTFNPTFPKAFPRFVQFAIWRYCSESGLNICNGNRIDDRHRCDNLYCQLRSRCKRVTLPKTVKNVVKTAT